MKIKILGTVEQNESGDWLFPRLHARAGEPDHVIVPKEDSASLGESDREPCLLNAQSGLFLYRRYVIQVSDGPFLSIEEILLRVKHNVLSRERAFDKLRREVEAFENFERLSTVPREPIPAQVRMFVWQRDNGKCVRCDSSERLEFDHIIPLAKGGSNTERNIQLLCEPCNRAKGSQI